MSEEKNICPICDKFSERELQKDDITRLLCRTFYNKEMVNADSFLIFEALFEKWKKGKAEYHLDSEINMLLQVEEVTDDGMESIKQQIIGFASLTSSKTLFREAIVQLTKYEDESLKPLLQGWLNKSFREYLLVGSTVNSLLSALEASGEKVRADDQDSNDWEANFDAARSYLIETMKVIT